jgi:hypothetical protein
MLFILIIMRMNMKINMTLDETWEYCLEMWRWIASVWCQGNNVDKLKRQWLDENGFGNKHITADCFFCLYAVNVCSFCPGRLVDFDFDCLDDEYYYFDKPREFYAKLLKLDKKRKRS